MSPMSPEKIAEIKRIASQSWRYARRRFWESRDIRERGCERFNMREAAYEYACIRWEWESEFTESPLYR